MASSFDTGTFSRGLGQLVDLSASSLKSTMERSMKTMNTAIDIISGLAPGKGSKHPRKMHTGCCPPEEECPPRCLISITRTAYAGERVVVPFKVRNGCNGPKTYRVGVRDLLDEEGSKAPAQPQLNKNAVTLEPGQAELVLMRIDLDGFQAGRMYETDIVVREKDINQNICFTLIVAAHTGIPEAQPEDERRYTSHFQGWESHFYCEPKRIGRDVIISADVNQKPLHEE